MGKLAQLAQQEVTDDGDDDEAEFVSTCEGLRRQLLHEFGHWEELLQLMVGNAGCVSGRMGCGRKCSTSSLTLRVVCLCTHVQEVAKAEDEL